MQIKIKCDRVPSSPSRSRRCPAFSQYWMPFCIVGRVSTRSTYLLMRAVCLWWLPQGGWWATAFCHSFILWVPAGCSCETWGPFGVETTRRGRGRRGQHNSKMACWNAEGLRDGRSPVSRMPGFCLHLPPPKESTTNRSMARRPIVRRSVAGRFGSGVPSGARGLETAPGSRAAGGVNGPAVGREVPESGQSGGGDGDPLRVPGGVPCAKRCASASFHSFLRKFRNARGKCMA